MAHPKHKVSSTRRDKRRTHYKAVAPTVVACSNCGAAVLYHRVCPECGFYGGKLAIEKKVLESVGHQFQIKHRFGDALLVLSLLQAFEKIKNGKNRYRCFWWRQCP